MEGIVGGIIAIFAIIMLIVLTVQRKATDKKQVEDMGNSLQKLNNKNDLKNNTVSLRCPDCASELILKGSVYICQNCGQAVKKEEIQENINKFHLHIADVFSITGRGTVITGMVESGMVCKQDVLIINGIQYSIMGIEFNEQIIDVATAGMNIGILVAARQNEFVKGALVTKQESI